MPLPSSALLLLQEDLAFFFTEELQNDDTPESVFLQKNDEIIVRKRRKPARPIRSGFGRDPIREAASAASHFINYVAAAIVASRQVSERLQRVGLLRTELPMLRQSSPCSLIILVSNEQTNKDDGFVLSKPRE